jgi:hypothetical protein
LLLYWLGISKYNQHRHHHIYWGHMRIYMHGKELKNIHTTNQLHTNY